MVRNPLASLLGRAAALGIASSAAVYGANMLNGPHTIKELENPSEVLNTFTTVIPPDYAKSLQAMETMKTGLSNSVDFLASNAKGVLLALDKLSGDAFTYDINKSKILGKLKLDPISRKRFSRFLNQREEIINESLPVYKTSAYDMDEDYIRTVRQEYPDAYSDIPDIRPDFVGNIIEDMTDDEAARLRKAYKLAVGFGGLALFGLGVVEGPKLRGFNTAKLRELLQGARSATGRAIDVVKPKAEKIIKIIEE